MLSYIQIIALIWWSWLFLRNLYSLIHLWRQMPLHSTVDITSYLGWWKIISYNYFFFQNTFSCRLSISCSHCPETWWTTTSSSSKSRCSFLSWRWVFTTLFIVLALQASASHIWHIKVCDWTCFVCLTTRIFWQCRSVKLVTDMRCSLHSNVLSWSSIVSHCV